MWKKSEIATIEFIEKTNSKLKMFFLLDSLLGYHSSLYESEFIFTFGGFPLD